MQSGAFGGVTARSASAGLIGGLLVICEIVGEVVAVRGLVNGVDIGGVLQEGTAMLSVMNSIAN